ncbi:uncharacterized protein K452DRAFT_273544 [Aplosporella prunicola CBS 121167]|uniref:Large ribosomal subunit protein uL4m n=1 Tax=Aplosporella prunicola CBS 121167 TaxID=1176127 RepID=A0A6A6B909_9PEZI|nr:uncharacterized protein K452DRAFT_273544 [Aplosporella prunicola CBS 121167]KAF2140752.1 hypothetical protein K452DRAFT_273544 [Aplosporella prunicola CBS 121167]
MATETALPSSKLTTSAHSPVFYVPDVPAHIQRPDAQAIIYSFPAMEPKRLATYPSSHLLVPLRRDLLHRAVVFEGDRTRQGTASTKWRDEVHGSNRKIRPQKGTGRARLGDKKSPMLRGGGVAFGPKPRDFATGLPRKIYDLAWRTALSYRYRRGELIVVEDGVELEEDSVKYLEQVFARNSWGNADRRSTIITETPRANLWKALEGAGQHGVAKTRRDFDVKNVLETGRLIIEKSTLDRILVSHQDDLAPLPGVAKSGTKTLTTSVQEVF